MKYYVPFGLPDVVTGKGQRWTSDDWQVLRDKHPRYRIADTREEWLADLSLDKDGQDRWMPERVASLANLIERKNITTVYSIGSGGGVFEYFLKKRLPHLKVIGTEYTAQGRERLRRVCTELDDVWQFDALNIADWRRIGRDPHSMVFINRNEREFSDTEWRQIWNHLYTAGIEHVFLGLMWTLTARALLQLQLRNMQKRLKGERLTLVGYIRNLGALRRLWKGKYQEKETIPFPTCTGLYLMRYT